MDKELAEYLVGGERFANFGGYRFDKLLFSAYILIILALFIFVFISFGSDKSNHIYYKCSNVGQYGSASCINPFYDQYPLCERVWDGACVQKTVLNGFSYGQPPPAIFSYWGFIVGGLLFFCFLINHFIYNKGFSGVADD